jgi:hypothetical protein
MKICNFFFSSLNQFFPYIPYVATKNLKPQRTKIVLFRYVSNVFVLVIKQMLLVFSSEKVT